MLFRGEALLESVAGASVLLLGVEALRSANSFVVVWGSLEVVLCRESSEASSDRVKLNMYCSSELLTLVAVSFTGCELLESAGRT